MSAQQSARFPELTRAPDDHRRLRTQTLGFIKVEIRLIRWKAASYAHQRGLCEGGWWRRASAPPTELHISETSRFSETDHARAGHDEVIDHTDIDQCQGLFEALRDQLVCVARFADL